MVLRVDYHSIETYWTVCVYWLQLHIFCVHHYLLLLLLILLLLLFSPLASTVSFLIKVFTS